MVRLLRAAPDVDRGVKVVLRKAELVIIDIDLAKRAGTIAIGENKDFTVLDNILIDPD